MKTLTTSTTLILLLVAIMAFSQDSGSTKTNESPRTEGLKKISSGSARNWDFDVRIDHATLKKNIEVAIETAMKSVEAIEKLEINIDPIEINLSDLNMSIDPIVVNVPDPVVSIDPIEINVPDIDIDEVVSDVHINEDHFRWNRDEEDDDNDNDNDNDNVNE